MHTEIKEVIDNLTSVITDLNRSMIEQCKAILVLRFLSVQTLEFATRDSWNALFSKFQRECNREKKMLDQDETNTVCFREVLTVSSSFTYFRIHLLYFTSNNII